MQEEMHTAEWIRGQIESASDPSHPGNIESLISGAYWGVIPGGKTLPAVRFHSQAANDARGAANPAHRILTQIDWLIVVVNEGLSHSALLPVADALDARLHEAQGTCPHGVFVHQCIRIQPFSLIDVEDSGATYRHAGGLYRTIVEPA